MVIEDTRSVGEQRHDEHRPVGVQDCIKPLSFTCCVRFVLSHVTFAILQISTGIIFAWSRCCCVIKFEFVLNDRVTHYGG